MKTKKNILLPQVSAPVVRSEFDYSHNELGTGVVPSIVGCYEKFGFKVCAPFAGNDAK